MCASRSKRVWRFAAHTGIAGCSVTSSDGGVPFEAASASWRLRVVDRSSRAFPIASHGQFAATGAEAREDGDLVARAANGARPWGLGPGSTRLRRDAFFAHGACCVPGSLWACTQAAYSFAALAVCSLYGHKNPERPPTRLLLNTCRARCSGDEHTRQRPCLMSTMNTGTISLPPVRASFVRVPRRALLFSEGDPRTSLKAAQPKREPPRATTFSSRGRTFTPGVYKSRAQRSKTPASSAQRGCSEKREARRLLIMLTGCANLPADLGAARCSNSVSCVSTISLFRARMTCHRFAEQEDGARPVREPWQAVS